MRTDSIFYAITVTIGFSIGVYMTYGLHATLAVLIVSPLSFIFGVFYGCNTPKKK